jgi:hypothetical protein
MLRQIEPLQLAHPSVPEPFPSRTRGIACQHGSELPCHRRRASLPSGISGAGTGLRSHDPHGEGTG